MFSTIIDLIVKAIVPILVTSVLGFIGFAVKWFKKTDKNMKMFREDIQNMSKELQEVKKDVRDSKEMSKKNDLALMWSQLKAKTDAIIEQGWCDAASLACIDQLYSRYVKLNGNHGMGVVVCTVHSLPTKPTKNKQSSLLNNSK